MGSEIEKTTVVTLKLQKDEALWLRDLVQYPNKYVYHYQKPEDEPEQDRNMKARFLGALEGVY